MPIGYKDRTDQFGRIIDTATDRARQDTALAEEGINRGVIGSIQAIGQIPANILSGYQKGTQFAEESKERQAKIQNASVQAKIGEADLAAQQEKQNTAHMAYTSKAAPGESLTVGQAQMINPLRVAEENASSTQQMRATQAQAAEDKAEAAQGMLGLKRQLAEKKANEPIDQKTVNKAITETDKEMNPGLSSRSNLAKVASRIGAGERLHGAISQYKGDLNSMPKEVLAMFVGDLNSMISNGSPTIEMMHNLMPKNVEMNGASMLSFLQSQPQGAQQEQYMKTMIKMLENEDNVNQKQLKEFQTSIATSNPNLGPEHKERLLRKYGIDPKDVDENGRYSPQTAAKQNFVGPYSPEYLQKQGAGEAYAAPIHRPSPEDASAMKWAKNRRIRRIMELINT